MGNSASVEIVVNGRSRRLPRETTVADLLVELALDPRRVAVEINCDLVPRSRHAQHRLAQGDQVEVASLVGGG